MDQQNMHHLQCSWLYIICLLSNYYLCTVCSIKQRF